MWHNIPVKDVNKNQQFLGHWPPALTEVGARSEIEHALSSCTSCWKEQKVCIVRDIWRDIYGKTSAVGERGKGRIGLINGIELHLVHLLILLSPSPKCRSIL